MANFYFAMFGKGYGVGNEIKHACLGILSLDKQQERSEKTNSTT